MLEGYGSVLVTGGLGFIGRHLVDALIRLGKRVTVVDSGATATRTDVPASATLVQADLRSGAQARDALAGAELVLHLAGNASGTRSVIDPRFDFETNAVGTFNVMEAARLAGARRVVYVSSASVYGRPAYDPMDEEHLLRPFVPYGASKLTGELVCRSFLHAHGLPVAMARPFCVYGPGEHPGLALVEVARYLRWHLNHRPIQIVGDPDRKVRDFVQVEDVVDALLLIADAAPPGEVFNVGSGRALSMRELVRVIERATGYGARIEALTEITDDTYSLVADISKLRGLGFEPRRDIEEGVADLARDLGQEPELPGGATIFRVGQRAEGETTPAR